MSRQLSRRGLLGAAAATGVALVTRGCGGDDDRFGGFRMSIQAWTFRTFATDAMLQMVHDLGLRRVELYAAYWPIDGTPDEIAAMRARLDDLALDCMTHGTNPFTADHEANRRVFAFAQAAGIRNLLADPPADAFTSLEQLVAEYDVRIAIHNHGPGSRYPRVADVQAALAGRDARIGTTVDTGHYIRSGEDPVAAIRTLGDRLYGVHLKDVAAAAADAPDVILGTSGLLDVAGVFRALRDVAFPEDASLSLEYEANPEDPYDDVATCLDVASRAARA